MLSQADHNLSVQKQIGDLKADIAATRVEVANVRGDTRVLLERTEGLSSLKTTVARHGTELAVVKWSASAAVTTFTLFVVRYWHRITTGTW